MQLPTNVDEKNLPKDVQLKVLVSRGQVGFSNTLGSSCPAPYVTYPDFYNPVDFISLLNAVTTYSGVVIIKSGNSELYIDPSSGKKYAEDKIWFDKKYGAVFLKDVYRNSRSRMD